MTQQPAQPAGPRTSSETVWFAGSGGTLAGTVVLPRTGGAHPALVLVHDTGDRSAQQLRPLAKALARAGIAILIYDKRGVGDSAGDWRAGDFEDLASDALAGVRLLQARADIQPQQVGLLGIGEGGWVAPIAAARSRDAAFLITIAAPGMSPIEQERYRRARALRSSGYGKRSIPLSTSLWLLACRFWQLLPDRRQSPLSLQAYFNRVCAFDPLPVWRQVRQPILALWGGQDERVPPRGSAWLLRQILATHPDSTLAILPDADHDLLPGGLPASAVSDEAVRMVERWIAARTAA